MYLSIHRGKYIDHIHLAEILRLTIQITGTDMTDQRPFNYYEALFNNAKNNCIILLQTDGTITSVNDAFSNHFGYQKNEITGKNIAVLFTEEDKKKGLPQNELSTVLREGQSSDNNYLVTKSQSITWVSGESILAKNKEGKVSILKVIQNIQDIKLTEGVLKDLNHFNESILSSIEDVVIVVDESLNLIKNNRAFYKLFKHNVPDTTSLNIAQLIKPYDNNNNLLNRILDTLNTKKSFSNLQIEIDTISGDRRIFDVSGAIIQHVTDNHVLLVIHDITIHKQVEREREDLIGFVAHELRNPLANVTLCNEIMTEAIGTNNMEEIGEMLQRSKNNVKRLNKMIADLYDVTRIKGGHLQLEISEFHFGEMIQEAIETVKILQPAYNLIIKGDANIYVSADRYRLIQVVTNYLSNGIKYSDGNTDVILSVEHNNEDVIVAVKDEGLGISEEELPYIFERFFRSKQTVKMDGVGLGLYLCEQVVSAHRGRVWAESQQGRGSTFYFSIPRNFYLQDA